MLLLASAFAAPVATLSWKSDHAKISITAAPDEHVQEAAGVRIEFVGDGTVTYEDAGSGSSPTPVRHMFLEVSKIPAGDPWVTARFSICDDAGTRCTPYTLRAQVVGRKGKATMVAQQVSTQAVSAGAVVAIYDFGAVWCPPCNLMLAEVLEDPADAALFAGRPVQRIDVDRPESWAQKSRYGVTGYPTLVAVDSAGNEVARLIGYPGEAALKAWLGALGTEPALHTLAAGAELPPTDRARAARRLAEADQDAAARRYLDGAEDGVDLRVAKLLLDTDKDAAAWLFDHKTPLGDWIWAAGSVLPERWASLLAYAPKAAPEDASGLYALAAGAAPKELAPGLKLAALVSVQAALTGEPAHDKALWGDVADLQAETGDRPAAVRTLDAAIAAFPDEFTFYYAAARVLLDGGDLVGAEKRAREALTHAFGDQVLRASVRLSDVLSAAGRKPEAKAVLVDALTKVPAPPEGVNVRTTRYRAEAEARKALLGG